VFSRFCRQVSPGLADLKLAARKRDFPKGVADGGEAARVGQAGRRGVQEVFAAWPWFRGGGCPRQELIDRLDAVAARRPRGLEQGPQWAPPKVVTFCGILRALLPALWKLVVGPGVAPTHTHAEQVRWRKGALGRQSAAGGRLVERLRTAVPTRRLQKRPVLPWLIEALTAHRHHLPAPSLLPTG